MAIHNGLEAPESEETEIGEVKSSVAKLTTQVSALDSKVTAITETLTEIKDLVRRKRDRGNSPRTPAVPPPPGPPPSSIPTSKFSSPDTAKATTSTMNGGQGPGLHHLVHFPTTTVSAQGDEEEEEHKTPVEDPGGKQRKHRTYKHGLHSHQGGR